MSGLSALFKSDAKSKPKINSNFNDRNKLRSASMSIGDDSRDFDEIDDTTTAIVLESLFIAAAKEWCEENQDKMLGALAAVDCFEDSSSMNTEQPRVTKKSKKM